MTANITYRQGTQVAPGSTTTKNAQLSNAEIDGNIKSLVSEIDTKAPTYSPTFTGTVSGITKTMVGLGNVDNTADTAKPVSTAQQTALNAKQDTLVSGTNLKSVGGVSLLGTGDVTSPTFAGPVVAYSFSPSSSTIPANGFYLPAGNTVAISTNTVEGLRVGADQTLTAGGPAAAPAFKVSPVASQVNYITNYGSATGNSLFSVATGSDTNIVYTIRAKGTGSVDFQTGSTPAIQHRVVDTAGATRFVTSTGSVAGNPALAASAGNLAINSPLLTTQGLFNTKVALGANNVDLSLGSVFTKTFTATTFTMTVSNVPATGTVASFVFEITNAGLATITWFTGTKWGSGSAPTLTSSGKDILSFYTIDGGTTWNGIVLAKAVA